LLLLLLLLVEDPWDPTALYNYSTYTHTANILQSGVMHASSREKKSCFAWQTMV
jgi:hypothetical protein